MPCFFICPKCKRNRYWNGQIPEGNHYLHDLDCNRCGQAGIFWVASEQVADWIDAPRDLIAIGVNQSSLGFIEKETPQSWTKDAVPMLQGVATLVSPYDQGERWRGFTPQVAKTENGQCAGQVLHWIRRVLQGGREGYTVPHQKVGQTRTDEQIVVHQRKQHVVGAAAHLLLDKRQDSAPNDELAKFDRKVDEIMQGRGGYAKINGRWQVAGNLSYSEANEKQDVINKVTAKRNELIAQMERDGFYSYAWEQMARDLDEYVTQKHGASSRPFKNIVHIRCVDRTKSVFGDGTARTFARTVVNDPELKPGRAAIVSLGVVVEDEKGQKVSGHAIGIHIDTKGQVFFFDPNLGVFQCKSREALRQALEILWVPVWNHMNWHIDGTFGFALFRKDDGAIEPKKHEKVIEYKDDAPKMTALQNQSRGLIPNSGPAPSLALGGGAPVKKKKTIPQRLKAIPKKIASKVSNLIHKFGGKHDSSKQKH